MRWCSSIIIFFTLGLQAQSQGPFAPAAGQMGTTAIHKDSSRIKAWAQNGWLERRGWLDIADTTLGLVSFGDTSDALAYADGQVLSLGDQGSFIYHLPQGIYNQPGPEFAVFENSFSDVFLELAHVEVSKNGQEFFRFPSECLSDSLVQLGAFGSSDPSNIHNLAGKYRADYGVPFDLVDIPQIDTAYYLRIVDAVGSIDRNFGSVDSKGRIINDPYPTDFASGGFDLDALALLKPVYLSADDVSDFKHQPYPNPATNLIYLDQAIELSLLNSRGEIVAAVRDSQIQVNTLTRGIYLLQATLKDGSRLRFKICLR